MNITLIGMSNLGKTHWAKRLETEAGYRRVDCDAQVEELLAPHLKSQGYSGVQDVAKWMGQPFDSRYPATSREFVHCERQAMLEIVGLLGQSHRDCKQPMVIDTCGSVIYSGDDIKLALQDLTRVVYLEASEHHRSQLFERYMAEPKPVIWGSVFDQQEGETSRHALARCYPLLLSSRAVLYENWAEIRIPYEVHRSPRASLDSVFSGLVPTSENGPQSVTRERV